MSRLDADGVRHYDGTIVKMNNDGVEVLSSEVDEANGETLRHYWLDNAVYPYLGDVFDVVAVFTSPTVITVTWQVIPPDDPATLVGYTFFYVDNLIFHSLQLPPDARQLAVTISAPQPEWEFRITPSGYAPGYSSFHPPLQHPQNTSNTLVTP